MASLYRGRVVHTSKGAAWPDYEIFREDLSHLKPDDFCDVLLGEVFNPSRFYVQMLRPQEENLYDLDDLFDDMKEIYNEMNASDASKGPFRNILKVINCSSISWLCYFSLITMLYSVYLKAQFKLSLIECEVREGIHCAVQLPGQADWYRAQLITDLGSGQLKVFLHDFGGYYTVTLTSLRWLLREVVRGKKFRDLSVNSF